MAPSVSVLIPVYNGMPYLVEAVESVQRQTLRDWRCVIVNDGSTDGTREYLDSLDDERFVILHQENAGISAAINLGLAHCDAEYIARLDADDVAKPTRLAEQLAFLDAHPDVGLVGTQVAPLGHRSSGSSLRLPLDHEEIFAALLAGRHAIVHASIMVRTALLQQIGGYWSLPTGEEYDMMLRAGEVTRLANMNRVLTLWRVHDQSLTGSRMKVVRFYVDYACELGRRRQAGLASVTLAEFRAERDSWPWWRRMGEAINLYARCHYRLALAEIHGGRRWRGAIRIACAALCAPRLTIERCIRVLRPARRPRRHAEPIAAAPNEVTYEPAEETMTTVGGTVG